MRDNCKFSFLKKKMHPVCKMPSELLDSKDAATHPE